jgi:hypothetical protein
VRKRLAKLFLMISLAWMVMGCAVTVPMAIAYSAGAVTVLENSAEAAKCYKLTKDTLKGIENNSSCGD